VPRGLAVIVILLMVHGRVSLIMHDSPPRHYNTAVAVRRLSAGDARRQEVQQLSFCLTSGYRYFSGSDGVHVAGGYPGIQLSLRSATDAVSSTCQLADLLRVTITFTLGTVGIQPASHIDYCHRHQHHMKSKMTEKRKRER